MGLDCSYLVLGKAEDESIDTIRIKLDSSADGNCNASKETSQLTLWRHIDFSRSYDDQRP